jgi:hypothetical protein
MATTSVSEPGMQGGVQYDEKGRPYILMADGRRNYISPAAFGEPVPEDTTGMFRQAPQWNNQKGEWETPIDWTNIANIGVGAGLTAGGLSAFGAFGAPAASGGTATVAPSTAGVGILSTIGSQFKNDPLGTLGSIGDRLGAGAAGAAQGRRDDSYAQANVGRVNLDALALDQKRAVLRSLLGGLQDATVNRPAGSTIPNFSVSGGLRPSALSNKDALMSELSRPSPTVEMPKPGMGEKLMGGAGSVLGMLGTLGKLRKPPVMMDDPANGGITGTLPRGGY